MIVVRIESQYNNIIGNSLDREKHNDIAVWEKQWGLTYKVYAKQTVSKI